MKTKFFSFFAASAMLFAASCSSTDIEESLIPEEPVIGDCVSVNVAVPESDMSMSRAVPDGWALRCVLWLVSVDDEGNPIPDPDAQQSNKAKMKTLVAPYEAGVPLRFTGVEPGKYALCAFCNYVKTAETSNISGMTPYSLNGVGLKNGDNFQFVASMGQDTSEGIVNIFNDIYDCWKQKVVFEKTDVNATQSITLKRAVSKVNFNVTDSDFSTANLASLKIFGSRYYVGIDLWSDNPCRTANGTIDATITDWQDRANTLASIYLPKQAQAINFTLTPISDDIDVTFKKVTVKNLLFDKVNVIYNVNGNMLLDAGTNVTVNVTVDNQWGNDEAMNNPDIEFANPAVN